MCDPATMSRIRKGDKAYEAACRNIIWNERIPTRRPDMIVTPSSESDVVTAVRFAREAGFQIAVRSGGHSWTGASLRDGGMLIDLGRLNAYSIDGQAERVSVQPAVAVRDLATKLSDAGLSFPTGHCPSVCAGGYLLAAGWGWNAQAWGPACHRVEAIDVVTADGELLHADAQHHPDLLWAARGGGPGFPGVVTRFHLRAFPLPRAIATSEYVFDVRHLSEVVGWLGQHGSELPPCIEDGMKLCWFDSDTPVLILSTIAFAASQHEAIEALNFFDATPVARLAISTSRNPSSSFAELYRESARSYPQGRRYDADTLWSEADPVALVSRVAELLTQAPSRASFLTLAFHRGSLPTAPAPGAALSMRGGLFVGCYAMWDAAVDDEANLAWVESLMRIAEPDIKGHYIGEMDLRRWHPSRAYAPEHWRRLQDLRAQVDPAGLFHNFLEPLASESRSSSKGSS